MEALKQEWTLRSPLLPKQGNLISIYFGGGTPSLLGPEKIETILSWISPPSTCEITLEANPENIAYFPGINRFSLGVQSFDPELLNTLTRIHDAKRAQDAVYEMVETGVENISIDLMYDLPGQSLSSWESTLDIAVQLPVKHISLYNLTIEPHTAFYKNKAALLPKIPNDKASLMMLEMAIEKLEAAGFERYEISAFAKPGFYSRHNTGYWKGRPFLGYGPSAFSYWEGARFQNAPNINKYAKKLKEHLDPTEFYEKLPYIKSLKERLAIRLRMLEELEEWPQELQNVYSSLQSEGYLEKNSLKLSNKGLLFHDTVAELIIN